MMNNKVFVIGANGMAGHMIFNYLKSSLNKFEVLSISRKHDIYYSDYDLDINNLNYLNSLILQHRPHTIINCIGLLNKNADENPADSILINSYFPHFLEKTTTQLQTKIIHLSTDCVFSGNKGGYKENDFKDAIGYYALSKSLGEINNKKDLTIRTSIIGPDLNPNGIGLFNWFTKQSGTINGYKNAIWTGVTTLELAKFIQEKINSNLSGIIHLVNNNTISKYELLCLFAKFFNSSLTIKPYDGYNSDKSLINTRQDINYHFKSYSEMVTEMKDWINNNKDLYKHYFNSQS
jgi:dTDP-4-dehydrorhamnose reductase